MQRAATRSTRHMKQYLHNDRELFEELIALVAEEMGLPEAAVLRDYYITYILDNLSQSDFKEHCIFKGGTSLSKCYPGTIERFSEDIDLTYIDTNGKSDKSISKKIKQIEQVMVVGFEYAPIPEERSNLSKSMAVWHSLEGRETSIKLEIGAKIHPLPIVEKKVQSYIHQYAVENGLSEVLDTYYFPDVALLVLDITRTFIDKVFAVKTQTLAGDIEVKIRHVYDVVQLYKHGEIQGFLQDIEQLRVIIGYAEESSKFYVTKRSLNTEEDLFGLYNFTDWRSKINQPHIRKAYETLHEELLYTDEKQSFNEALKTLEAIDETLGKL